MRFLHQIPSVRMKEKAGDWWVGRAISPKGPSRALGQAHAVITSIEDVGVQEVYAIKTSTETLIADGLMSHNSSGKSLSVMNAFWSAQNYDQLIYRKLMHAADLADAEGEPRAAKAFREQAKRERDQYAGGLKCLYIAAEKLFDPEYVEELGVRTDEDSLEVVMTTRIEEIGDIVQQALSAYHVIAIDSTTDTISMAELNDKDGVFNNRLGAARAQKWGQMFDWMRDRISPENVLIYTSQITSRIGMNAQAKIEGEQAPGGKKMEHDSSMTLHFMKGAWLKSKKTGGFESLDKEGGDKGAFGKAEAAGMEVVVRCDKSRISKSHRVALLHHDKAAHQFDPLYDYEKLAKYFKVVQTNGSWVVLPDGSKTQQLRPYIEEHPELARQIEDVVLRCASDPQFEKELLRSKGGPGEPILELVA